MNSLLSQFRNNSLARRLLIVALVLGITIALVGTTLIIVIFKYELENELKSRVEQAFKLTKTELITAIDTRDNDKINLTLRKLSNLPHISRVELRTQLPNGMANITQDSPDAAYFASKGTRFEFEFGPDSPETPVSMVIYAHQDPFYERSSLLVVLGIGVNFLVIFCLSFGMLYFVKKLIFRHLSKIATYARQLSVDNLGEPLTLNRRASKENPDELDAVIIAIEQMRTQLIDDLDQRRAIELALIAEKEEKLETRKLIEDAKASDRAKSQFIATMSHEIRTPMNGVIGMIEMLRSTQMDDEQLHYLDVISRSGESLMNIINDILDYSKIEAGKLSIETIEFDVEELIDDCLELFSGTAHLRNLELMGNLGPGTPQKLVGDPTRLRQVLVNLVGNAFKFTNEGSILIEANVISGEHDNYCTLHFSVSDSGIGIEANVQQAIFEAFKQADSTTTRKYGGTGLGLAICKQLVELMGGRIGLHSEPKKGATFWFTCRFERVIEESLAPKSCSLALSRKTLLYIHPTDFMDEALIEHAAQNNLSIEISRNAKSALETLSNHQKRYDFVLLSQKMGNENGLELAQKIREFDAYFETPIIMLTNEQTSTFSLDDLMSISSLIKRPFCVRKIIDSLLAETTGISLNQLIPTAGLDEPKKVQLEVLVAEDNIVNRMVIEGLLEKLNIKPDFSENGIQAVERFVSLKKKYDLILMDCEMPEMDGFEATLKIRQFESDRGSPHVPIIALTAHVEAEHRQRVIDVGMNYYVSKPVTLEKITDALQAVSLA